MLSLSRDSRPASWSRIIVVVAAVLFPALALAQPPPPAPPSNLAAADHPWDNATRIDLTWSASPDDATLQGYVIRRRTVADSAFTIVDIAPGGRQAFTVQNLRSTAAYLFEVSSITPAGTESAPAVTVSPVSPTMEWFDGTRIWFLVTLLLLSGAVAVY